MDRQPFADGGFYHIYNRGVDKRKIFLDKNDVVRFLKGMKEFNNTDPIGSLYVNSFRQLSGETAKSEKIVELIAYCLNPNHFHFILEQKTQSGISEFMKRLSGGYTWYFNHKYKRSGALLQGTFKSKFIASNKYLLYLSSYVNLNNRAHQLKAPCQSSWEEYIGKQAGFCKKDIILDQFSNLREYEKFAEDALVNIVERKKMRQELEHALFEEV